MAQKPAWVEVRDLAAPPELTLIRQLDAGESEAIQLAMDLKADALIMDERAGRDMAASRRITVIGILGVLLESYRRGTIHSPTARNSNWRKCFAGAAFHGFSLSRNINRVSSTCVHTR